MHPTHAALENDRATLYAFRVRRKPTHFPTSWIAALACWIGVAAPLFAEEQHQAPAAGTPPIVAYYDFKRLGSPAFTFVAPSDWVPLSGASERVARLEYIANLREVLDAPPDVPPGSFDRLISFAGYYIPEVNGYLIATVFDATVYPVQLFDVLHMHARGSNDWGESLYIRVEAVHRNQRLSLDGNPALAVDVEMSGNLSIAAEYFQVPSTFNRIGGVVLLLPSNNWTALAPLVAHIRDSIEVGASYEAPPAASDAYTIAELGEEDAPLGVPVGGAYEVGRGRLWNPTRDEDSGRITGGAILIGLIVIAVAYPLIFVLTLRLIYVAIFLVGSFVSSAIDLEAHRKAAESNPWTMGLLRSERMIMLTALVSMGLAALLLAVFLQAF